MGFFGVVFFLGKGFNVSRIFRVGFRRYMIFLEGKKIFVFFIGCVVGFFFREFLVSVRRWVGGLRWIG